MTSSPRHTILANMHIEDDEHLLMIEPTGTPTSEPLVDDLTRRMAGALTCAEKIRPTRGWHACTGRGCQANSDNVTHMVEGYATNSLAVHYLAHHRDEVPHGELAKVAALNGPDAEPTPRQLSGRRGD